MTLNYGMPDNLTENVILWGKPETPPPSGVEVGEASHIMTVLYSCPWGGAVIGCGM